MPPPRNVPLTLCYDLDAAGGEALKALSYALPALHDLAAWTQTTAARRVDVTVAAPSQLAALELAISNFAQARGIDRRHLPRAAIAEATQSQPAPLSNAELIEALTALTATDLGRMRVLRDDLGPPPAAVEELFARVFGCAAPTSGVHFYPCWEHCSGQRTLLGYGHMTDHSNLWLAGGLITDRYMLRTLEAPIRAELRSLGGVAAWLNAHVVNVLAEAKPATFHYTGNARSRALAIAHGARELDHPYLLIRENRPLATGERAALINDALAVGPF